MPQLDAHKMMSVMNVVAAELQQCSNGAATVQQRYSKSAERRGTIPNAASSEETVETRTNDILPDHFLREQKATSALRACQPASVLRACQRYDAKGNHIHADAK